MSSWHCTLQTLKEKKLYKEYTENANDNDNEHNFYPRQIYI